MMLGVTPDRAFTNGFSLSLALREKKGEVKMLLLSELERLVRHVNATRTFQSQSDLQDAVDDICELFPSMKMEEVLIAFKYIRQGRYELYGNFTTNTLLECIRNYEMGNTVLYREQQHYENKKTIQTATLDVNRLLHDLEKDGKLRNPRKLLDRTYIPYPNDKTDIQTKSTDEHKEEATQEARPETNEARTTGKA